MIVDDHVLMRMGLTFTLNSQHDMEVVGQAEDGDEAIEVYCRCQPDVVVIDLRMPKRNGIETIAQLRQSCDVRALVLSNYGIGDEISAALQAGALGFVAKDTPLEGLLTAIRTVQSGERFVPPEIARRLAGTVSSQLSAREHEVFLLLGKGMSNKEAAAVLNVTEATIKAHVTGIFVKLRVSDRTQAVLTGIKRGIIRLE